MRISEIFPHVIRDADFSTIGFLPTAQPDMLVPISAPKYLSLIDDSVAAVVTSPAIADQIPKRIGVAIDEVPMDAFWAAHERLDELGFYWQDFDTEIDPTALVSDRAYVASKNVRIGAGVVIEPNVTILERVVIDEFAVIRAGAVLGTVGFEVREIGGKTQVVKHTGGVHVRRGAQLMANTCVSSALMGGWTEIGEEAVLDNLVHVAHNVRIGPRAKVAAHAMLAGSSTIGARCWIGPNSSVSNSLAIGDDARVTIGAVVVRNVPEGGHVTGNFALDHTKFLQNLRKLR